MASWLDRPYLQYKLRLKLDSALYFGGNGASQVFALQKLD